MMTRRRSMRFPHLPFKLVVAIGCWLLLIVVEDPLKTIIVFVESYLSASSFHQGGFRTRTSSFFHKSSLPSYQSKSSDATDLVSVEQKNTSGAKGGGGAKKKKKKKKKKKAGSSPKIKGVHNKELLIKEDEKETKLMKSGTTTSSKRETSTKKKQKTTKKKKKKKKKDKILHWRVDLDVPIVEFHNDYDDDDNNSSKEPMYVRFKVHGNPLPLRRHRTSGGFMYNPSAPAQASFANITKQILNSTIPVLHNHISGSKEDATIDNNPTTPLFPSEMVLVLSILFRMKRPNTHFVGNKPGPGRLRESAPPVTSITRTDVDNLAKFVLDSLNGILYEDDRQIFSLHATKILDNDDSCQGSTEISCRPLLSESDLAALIENSINPLANRDKS